MPSVFFRKGKWVLKWKDELGHWKTIRSNAKTKTEARHLAQGLEDHAWEKSRGLSKGHKADDGRTVADLVNWWLDNFSKRSPSHTTNKAALEKHLLGSDAYPPSKLARIRLRDVTRGQIESWLDEKEKAGLAPQTVNHLRGFLQRAFSMAESRDVWPGPNPVSKVARRRIPKRLPSFLLAEEVPALLRWVAPQWQDFFAAAVYTGMRKGELSGLLKREVDIRGRRISVGHSYERDVTKGGDEDAIPIAAELVPYLERAMGQSKTPFVFVTAEGKPLSRETKVDAVLKSALRRAGIVSDWVHKCRRCGHRETHHDDTTRRCPKCKFKLWPVGTPKRLRFHDLRHTTASLLLMSGVPLIAVSRILRHSDPKITAEVYGHLEPNWLQTEIDKLAFGVGEKSAPHGAPVVHKPSERSSARKAPDGKPQ